MKFYIFGAMAIAIGFSSSAAIAQESYSAGKVWGTSPSGVAVNGALSSSAMHLQQGTIAGQVHAAEKGFLLSTGDGSSLSIQAIGSQSIVTSTISGNNIDSNVTATQDSSNTGSVSNNGTITGK